jgi:hypothetical protein
VKSENLKICHDSRVLQQKLTTEQHPFHRGVSRKKAFKQVKNLQNSEYSKINFDILDA